MSGGGPHERGRRLTGFKSVDRVRRPHAASILRVSAIGPFGAPTYSPEFQAENVVLHFLQPVLFHRRRRRRYSYCRRSVLKGFYCIRVLSYFHFDSSKVVCVLHFCLSNLSPYHHRHFSSSSKDIQFFKGATSFLISSSYHHKRSPFHSSHPNRYTLASAFEVRKPWTYFCNIHL